MVVLSYSRDYEDCCEVNLVNLLFACILGAFVVEMLDKGCYSMMESLIQHGW